MKKMKSVAFVPGLSFCFCLLHFDFEPTLSQREEQSGELILPKWRKDLEPVDKRSVAADFFLTDKCPNQTMS